MGALFRLPAVAADATASRGPRPPELRPGSPPPTASRSDVLPAPALGPGSRWSWATRAPVSVPRCRPRHSGGWRSRSRPGSNRSTWRWRRASFCTRSRVVFDGVPMGIVVGVAAVFGAAFGSFLNVCILRWGAEPKQSVVRPPSRCPRCGRSLSWYENVPVLWLVLRGRCRGCGLPIAIQYPLIELTVAVIWAAWPGGSVPASPRWRERCSSPSCSGSRSPTRGRTSFPTSSPRRTGDRSGARGAGRMEPVPGRGPGGRGWLRPPLAGGHRRHLAVQAGSDGRRRHQDDGNDRRVRRLEERAAHRLSRRLAGQPHLRSSDPGRQQATGAVRHLPRARRRRVLLSARRSWHGMAAS